MTNNPYPRIRCAANKQRGQWQAVITWAPGQLQKVLTGIPLTIEAPAEGFEFWKRAAMPALAQARAEADRPKKKDTSLAALIDWYLDTHLDYMGRAETTRKLYRGVLTKFRDHCHQSGIQRAEDISTRIVQAYIAERAEVNRFKKPSTLDTQAIRTFLKDAHEAGELPNPPKIRWQPKPKNRSRYRACKPVDVDRLIDTLEIHKPYLANMVKWARLTGWRIGDICDLRWHECNMDAGEIHRIQMKTRKGLPYPITDNMRALLEAVPRSDKDDHVFLGRKVEPIAPDAAAMALTHHNDRHGLPRITFRDLRVTFATERANAGCPPAVLKELMGHSDISIALQYYVDVDLGRMGEWL